MPTQSVQSSVSNPIDCVISNMKMKAVLSKITITIDLDTGKAEVRYDSQKIWRGQPNEACLFANAYARGLVAGSLAQSSHPPY